MVGLEPQCALIPVQLPTGAQIGPARGLAGLQPRQQLLEGPGRQHLLDLALQPAVQQFPLVGRRQRHQP